MNLFRSYTYNVYIYITEKKGFLEKSSVEHRFELPECSRYDHQLKRIISCFLGVVPTIHLQFLLHHTGLVSEVVCYGQ